MEFADIEKKAEELAEKNSWIRNSTKELMEKWKEISEKGEYTEEFKAETSISAGYDPYQDMGNYYLVTGHKEIKCFDSAGDKQDMSGRTHFSNAMKMPRLRQFLKEFPKLVENITNQMKEKNEENEEVIELLKKLQ